MVTDLVIPNSVIQIKDFAFCHYNSLTSVMLGNSVAFIGDGAFGDCSSLISVTIPNSINSIGKWAFDNCESLTEIKFEGTVEEWEMISKGFSWNSGVPATKVICTNGEVAI